MFLAQLYLFSYYDTDLMPNLVSRVLQTPAAPPPLKNPAGVVSPLDNMYTGECVHQVLYYTR